MSGEISAEELRTLLESNGDVRIVDIRSPGAFSHERIPGSENVPFQELTSRIEEFADAEQVVTVCPHGKASVQAARLIESFEGFSGEVDSLESGIEDWPYELETDAPDSEERLEEESDAPF
jgi:rhodanese-related sulfurtransferase